MAQAVYRSKIQSKSMSAVDWVNFLKDGEDVAISLERYKDDVIFYFTEKNGFYITTSRSRVRPISDFNMTEVDVIEEIEDSADVDPLQLRQAPFGDLLR